ncbi:MAG: hypothetical protein JNM55_22500 [Anaerolineales bacterium]|nr:hypothetical protein [Anaerolineales bacterium]
MKPYFFILLLFALSVSSCRYTEDQGYISADTSLQLSKLSASGYSEKEFTCNTYVHTTWGSGLEQWGDPVELGRSHDLLPPLIINSQNEVYFADYANHRLLKYDGKSSKPVQIIPVPEYYFLEFSKETLQAPWYSIAITPKNIIIPYGIQEAGVLSLDGHEVENIKLPYPYNFELPVWQPIWIDARGGLLLNGERVAYFDKGWEKGEWDELSTGFDAIKNPFSWSDSIGGVSGASSNIYLYKIDVTSDFLKAPTNINNEIKARVSSIGIDENGWFYMYLPDLPELVFTRYSVSDGAKQMGTLKPVTSGNIVHASVSPDGNIYLIVYDRKDAMQQPQIIKCHFVDQ